MPKKMGGKETLLTAAKIAELLGVSKTEVQKSIKEANIKPDAVKCGCSYFSEESIEKIKNFLKK